ncbi:MAG: class III extradiol dioxygenase subunit B-like domain-containing protein [Candidatus Paceibacterota bacterium]|jgi:aromatic ring-opening dioxygenase LigB subunit
MISFACFSPHPPILLPSVGSEADRALLKNTIGSLDSLGKKLEDNGPDLIIISSPHADWGFNVPLHFLAKNFQGQVKTYLTGPESPRFHFEEGRRVYTEAHLESDFKKVALIASGDMSHCLKEDGPYGFNPEGPKFDKDFQEFLVKKELDKILQLNDTYPDAGECGLRSFSFLLGVLDAAKAAYQPGILSYEGPFGVGYLVADFKFEDNKIESKTNEKS